MTQKQQMALYRHATKIRLALSSAKTTAINSGAGYGMYYRCLQGATTWIEMAIDYTKPKDDAPTNKVDTNAPIPPGGNE